MKVCIFTNHFCPEDFKVNDIAFELTARGYDITVITAVPDYPKGSFFDGYSWFKRNRETVRGCRVIRLPVIPRGRGGGIQLALQYLSYYISASVFTFFHAFRYHYDAVFVHLTSPFFIGLAATHLKRRQHIPMIFWTLDLWPESVSAASSVTNGLVLKSLTRMVQRVYDNCDRILIGSKGFETSILEKGDYRAKLVYYPNWCESVCMPKNTAGYEQIQPFASCGEHDFIVLFAGNIGEAQNLECVLDAAQAVQNEKNIKFVFLGDGRARKALMDKAAETRLLNDTVFFPGRFPLEAMPYFMNRASVLLVSLKDEPIFNLTVPSKVQFYMAQGKPVLALLNGDGADLIHAAQCGIAVGAADTVACIEALKTMQAMPKGALAQMGAAGKRYYELHFRKEQRIEQLSMILQDTIDKKQRGSIILTEQNRTEQNSK